MERVMLLEKPSPSLTRNSHAVLLNNPFGKKTDPKNPERRPCYLSRTPPKGASHVAQLLRGIQDKSSSERRVASGM